MYHRILSPQTRLITIFIIAKKVYFAFALYDSYWHIKINKYVHVVHVYKVPTKFKTVEMGSLLTPILKS